MTPLPQHLLESVAAEAVREGLADALYTTLATPIEAKGRSGNRSAQES